MADKNLKSKILIRRDTADNWSTNNPVLLNGELGYDTTNKKLKIGDGTSTWSQLSEHIDSKTLDFNLINSEGISSLAQKYGAFSPVASGINSVAFNGARYDKVSNGNPTKPLTQALGAQAFASGGSTIADGDYSHTEGKETKAYGQASHAEGANTVAGKSSDAKTAYIYAHAEGGSTTASGQYSHSENEATTASGKGSHAEGFQTVASNNYSHAEGQQVISSGIASHAEGISTQAFGIASHAEGQSTIAKNNSHAEGESTNADGENSHAEGSHSIAYGYTSHVEGYNTKTGTASGNSVGNGHYSHAEGIETIAAGDNSHAEGMGTQALQFGTHAEGYYTLAGLASDENVDITPVNPGTGTGSSGTGSPTTVRTDLSFAHAEGRETKALGIAAHSEGLRTVAKNEGTHAQGIQTHATGYASHAEGYGTYAMGQYSHAQGNCSYVYNSGESSFAGGTSSSAYKKNSFVYGDNVVSHAENQFIVGKYNDHTDYEYLFGVGNGTSDTDRRTIFKVNKTGTATVNADPVNNLDVATKQYVDNHSSGGSGKLYSHRFNITNSSAIVSFNIISTDSSAIGITNVYKYVGYGDICVYNMSSATQTTQSRIGHFTIASSTDLAFSYIYYYTAMGIDVYSTIKLVDKGSKLAVWQVSESIIEI